jgi:C1A family cysteine protease
MTGEVIDHSYRLGSARDQGNRGTCLAFAATAAHEAARLDRRGNPREDLSEESLYWACKQADGNLDPGTSPDALSAALVDPGQPAAELWAYDPDRNERDSYTPPAPALALEALRHARLEPLSVDTGSLKDALRRGEVVVLGLELWDAFYAAGSDVITAPQTGDLIGDLHAVALVGFDEDARTLLLRNSWGDQWGRDGYGKLAEDALRTVCVGAWRILDDLDT